jgi:hypothetical protein
LADNWRVSVKMASIADMKNTALGTSATPDPRRYETSFYIEKIPTDAALLSNLKKDRDTAALGLGMMYDNLFSNRPLATKTLYNLVDNQPVEDTMLKALYQIFAMNYEHNPEVAERAKKILLSDYPYTSYAEFAKNPRGNNFVKSSETVEQAYTEAYNLYKDEKFEKSKNLIEKTIKENPKDALVPKLTLLNALLSGKLAGKEVMILQLEQIVLNYAKTPEGLKAKEMLNYLKSDLKMNLTDQHGNAVQNTPNAVPVAPPNTNGGGLFNSPGDPTPPRPMKNKADFEKRKQEALIDSNNTIQVPKK